MVTGPDTKLNLTALQRLYWVGQTLRPDSPLLNNILTFTFPLELDPDHFQTAFHTFAAASDALRATLLEIKHEPYLHIHSTPPSPLRYHDLSDTAVPAETLDTWIEKRRGQALDITHCLYDTALFRLAPNCFVWYLNQHHLITDATSIFLVYQGVIDLYQQLVRGESIIPPDLPPFADFVAFKEKYRRSPRYRRAAAFWEKSLGNGVGGLQVAARATPRRTSRVQRFTYDLPPDEVTTLAQIAARPEFKAMTSDLSRLNVVGALLFAHLYQLSGQRDLATMITIHNRPTVPFKQTVGLLMEMCPLLVTLAEKETFPGLGKKFKEAMRPLLIHYQYGSEVVRQHHAIDVTLTMAERPSLTCLGHPVAQRVIHTGHGSETFALHVHEFGEDGRWRFFLDYHQDVFSPAERVAATAAFHRLLAHFLTESASELTTSPSWSPAPSPAQDEPPPVFTGYVPPRTPLEATLQAIWQQVLDQPFIGIHDNFFHLGGESWQAVRLLAEVEKATGQYLPIGVLLRAGTIAEMAQQVGQSSAPDGAIQIQAGSREKRPFFCLPGAAGNTLAIARIAKHLDPSQPVYTCLMPGLQPESEPPYDVVEAAAAYVRAIRTAQPHGPYHLGGFSAGAIFALEAAQQLRAAGEEVALLVSLDMPVQEPRLRWAWRGVHGLSRLLGWDAEQEREGFIRLRNPWHKLIYFLRRELRGILGRQRNVLAYLWRADREQKLAALVAARHQPRLLVLPPHTGGASPPPLPPELADAPAYTAPPGVDMDSSAIEDERLRALFDHNDRLVRLYVPRPYDAPVLLIRCPIGYGRPDLRVPDETMNWNKIAAGQVTVHEVPAPGHLALVREPYVRLVSGHLQAALNNIES